MDLWYALFLKRLFCLFILKLLVAPAAHAMLLKSYDLQKSVKRLHRTHPTFRKYSTPKNHSTFITSDDHAHIFSLLNHKKSLAVYDVDDTLFTPPGRLGSSSWFYSTAKQVMEEKNVSFKDASSHIYPLALLIQNHTKVCPTQEDLPHILTQLKTQMEGVIGLTARRSALAPRTLAQLQDLGMQLGLPDMSNHCFLEEVTFQDGVIFAGEANKGIVLANFIDNTNRSFEEIFFIDDSEENTHKVKKAMEEKGIKCTVIHYTKLSHLGKDYDHKKAEEELAHFFKKLLSSPERKAIECLLETDAYSKEIYRQIRE